MLMKTFWDDKYLDEAYLYGKDPNAFFAEQLKKRKPGRLLLPAEGEGRNAVYAASLGWEVWAFDTSTVGRKKALKLAKEKGVEIRYFLIGIEEFDPGYKRFDAVGLFYTHFPPAIRTWFCGQICNWLKPSGIVVLEGFEKGQLLKNSGGPKSESLLFSTKSLRFDFLQINILQLEDLIVNLNEGIGHQGEAHVVRMLAEK